MPGDSRKISFCWSPEKHITGTRLIMPLGPRRMGGWIFAGDATPHDPVGPGKQCQGAASTVSAQYTAPTTYPLAGKSTPLQRVVIDSVTTSQGTEPGKQGKYDELHMSTSLVVADSYGTVVVNTVLAYMADTPCPRSTCPRCLRCLRASSHGDGSMWSKGRGYATSHVGVGRGDGSGGIGGVPGG